jgi:DNA invertase Pin-like site-specific DNA recombinase
MVHAPRADQRGGTEIVTAEPKKRLRATLYTRVSELHGTTETSTDRQLALCRAYAESQEWDVIEHRTDRGISAYKKGVDRPGWRQVIADVEAGRTDVVLVHALDRAGRNAADLLKFVETCSDHGVRFASATQPIDTGSTYGGVIIAVLAAVAEVESAVKRERALSKVAELQENGEWTGGARPFGFRVEDKKLVPDDREGALLRDAAQRFLAGTSLRSIAREWTERGVRGPQGGRTWTAGTVRNVLASERHKGTTLTRRDHGRLLAKVEAASEEFSGYNRSARYMLTGLLVCGVCGARMAGRPEHGQRRYVCKRTGRVHLSISADLVEDLVTRRASQTEAEPSEGVVDPATLSAPLLAALDATDLKLDDWARKAAAAGLSASEIRAGREPLVAERDRLQAELDAVPSPGGWSALLDEVPDPTSVEWRAYLETVIDHVEIGPGQGAPNPAARVLVTWRHGVREFAPSETA